MRKYFSLIVSFSILVVVIFLWDLIKLPYNQENLILGEYSNKKFNPLNEIVRFSLFVILPFLIYLVCYLKFNKKETYGINPKDKNYFLFKKEDKNVDELKYYFFFFVALISIEFLSCCTYVFANSAELLTTLLILSSKYRWRPTLNKIRENTAIMMDGNKVVLEK